MTTVINHPVETPGSGTSAGAGVVIGAAIVVLALIVAAMYSLPYIRKQIDEMRSPGNPTINVTLPAPTSPDTAPKTE